MTMMWHFILFNLILIKNSPLNPGSVQSVKPKAKLAALSNSLAAVAAEKAQSEAKFLADKRKMRKELEDTKLELENVQKTEADTKVSLEETKSKLIIERHERDKEMNNNKLMVQELQKLVADERNEKEKLKTDLLQLKSKVILLEDPSKNKQSESQITKLKEDLENAKMQIVVKEKQLKEQDVTERRIGDIRSEMGDMKQKHLEQLKNAETAREKAELRALEIQSQQVFLLGILFIKLNYTINAQLYCLFLIFCMNLFYHHQFCFYRRKELLILRLDCKSCLTASVLMKNLEFRIKLQLDH